MAKTRPSLHAHSPALSASSSAQGDANNIVKIATVQFDPQGDVIFALPCTEGIVRFQINSSIVCLQSPVFRAMMGKNSHFKEARDLATRDTTSPPLEISLADDDPKALAIILRILHLQHNFVPINLDEDRLYQVAILCDKYDLGQALRIHSEQWLRPHLCKIPEQADKWLYMAQAFALPEFFKICSKMVIQGIYIKESGDPVVSKDSTSLNENISSTAGM